MVIYAWKKLLQEVINTEFEMRLTNNRFSVLVKQVQLDSLWYVFYLFWFCLDSKKISPEFRVLEQNFRVLLFNLTESSCLPSFLWYRRRSEWLCQDGISTHCVSVVLSWQLSLRFGETEDSSWSASSQFIPISGYFCWPYCEKIL